MTDDGKSERNPESHGRRETDAVGVEFDRFKKEQREQVARWIRRGIFAMAIIGLTVAISLAGVGFVLRELDAVRSDYVRANCESSNKRNEDTSNQLIALAAVDEANAKTEAAKADVRNRRDVTLVLIDLLSPVEDCDYLVALALGEADPTPAPTPPRAILPPTPTP